MVSQRRRLASYLFLVVIVLLVYTFLYSWGMANLEGEPRGFFESLAIVVETVTTTGFGEDAGIWDSPPLLLLMVIMQFTGVAMLFLTLPLFVAPWVESRLETTVPTSVDGFEDHTVLCEFTARGETVIDELDSWDRSYVIVEPDRDRAVDLVEAGMTVIHGDPESTETLRGARVPDAQTVVIDAIDERNAAITLSVREVDPDVQVITFTEDRDMATYLRYAGADEVFSPRKLLGEGLANEVSTAVTADLGDTVVIGSDLEVVELPIQRNCAIDGVPLEEGGIRERTGVNVIGIWRNGEFLTPPPPDIRLADDMILLVSGDEDQLSELKRLTSSVERRRAAGRIIVAGYGLVGSTIVDELDRGGMDVVVIDREESPRVDVVGDVTDESTFREANLESASSLIIAVSDDTTAMLATLIATEIADNIRIVVRAQETESVGKLYRAGADYVLALATVSGRMIASTVLDEEVMAPEKQIEIVRIEAPELVGQTLEEADIRHRTGCTVIAIDRDEEVRTDVGPNTRIEPGDRLIVAGTDEAMVELGNISH